MTTDEPIILTTRQREILRLADEYRAARMAYREARDNDGNGDYARAVLAAIDSMGASARRLLRAAGAPG